MAHWKSLNEIRARAWTPCSTFQIPTGPRNLETARSCNGLGGEGGHGLGLFFNHAAHDLDRGIARDLTLAEHDQPWQVGPGQVFEHGPRRART